MTVGGIWQASEACAAWHCKPSWMDDVAQNAQLHGEALEAACRACRNCWSLTSGFPKRPARQCDGGEPVTVCISDQPNSPYLLQGPEQAVLSLSAGI